MITERYISQNYRPHLVGKRYVRIVCGQRVYRVYECANKSKAQNREKALTRIGAGPTIREYDCTADHLPPSVLDALEVSGGKMVEWKS